MVCKMSHDYYLLLLLLLLQNSYMALYIMKFQSAHMQYYEQKQCTHAILYEKNNVHM